MQNLIINLGLEQVDRVPLQFRGKADNIVVQPGTFVFSESRFSSESQLQQAKRWVRGGPRGCEYYRVPEVKVVLVVVGSVCPGLNNVIRDFYLYYSQTYGVQEVYCAQHGLNGLCEEDWILLNDALVKDIHLKGGFQFGLGSGPVDTGKVLRTMVARGANHVVLVGGRGGMLAAEELQHMILEQRLKISVCLVPKFPEDSCTFVQSFGFCSIIEEAVRMIETVYSFAHSHHNGVGILKLSGKRAGFLAVKASLAARKVAATLIP